MAQSYTCFCCWRGGSDQHLVVKVRNRNGRTKGNISSINNIRLVTLFITLLTIILILFALSIGTASYFIKQSNASLGRANLVSEIRAGVSSSMDNFRVSRQPLVQAVAASRIGDKDSYNQAFNEGVERIKSLRSALMIIWPVPISRMKRRRWMLT